jgi:hypothetical protein
MIIKSGKWLKKSKVKHGSLTVAGHYVFASGLLLLLGLATVFFFVSCDGGGGGTTSSSDSSITTTSETLDTYSDDVKALTPYVGTSGYLDDWDTGWNPDNDFTVFNKLFGNESVESLYGPVEALDDYIEMVNSFADYWDTDGDITDSDEPSDIAITINNDINEVTLPFFKDDNNNDITVEVDRVVTVESSDEGYLLHMAFTVDAEQQNLVAYYEMESGEIEIGVYYGTMNSISGDLEIWHASSSTMNINFKWKGNLDEDWFAITQITDGCSGNQQVMGGGSINDEMAFISKNEDTNSSLDEYYVTVTNSHINDGSTYSDTPTDAGTTPPDGTGSLAYITEGNVKCIGWLEPAERPTCTDDIVWNN